MEKLNKIASSSEYCRVGVNFCDRKIPGGLIGVGQSWGQVRVGLALGLEIFFLKYTLAVERMKAGQKDKVVASEDSV